ncbi:MAG TPA: CehA/McbA family metallohydrolase [Flavitalea sp.]|nr:CehA/McbA family metallohydrolase [Flavitalea sp.]
MEEDTRKVTPVMVCITNAHDTTQILIPPKGDKAGVPTEIPLFMKGIQYSADKNWVGPVRLTNGLGNNENRSGLYGMLPSLPYWHEPVMYQTSGDFSITLPAGDWRIALQHGNEYIPIADTLHVTPKKRSLVKTYVLKRWINMPQRGWLSGDVHVHHPTNNPSFKEYLLQFGRAENVHMLNMLEMGHHLGTDFKVDGFGKAFRMCRDNVCLVSGQEDPRTENGHIIGLNIDYQVRDTSTYNYYDNVFKGLHMQPGALVGYAHFSWNGFHKGFPWHLATGEIDFVELLQFLRLNTIDYYDVLNLGFKITAAAGSDFPWASTIGDVRTFAYTGNDFSPDAWFLALKEGHTFVTNGPALFMEADGKLPGTQITSASGTVTQIKAKALSNPFIGNITRVAIYNNEGLVSEKMNTDNADSVSMTVPHTLLKSQWLSAVVYCDNGAVAHTTPVYFMVDGKPTFDKNKAPAIIQKQVEAIQKLKDEENAKPNIDKGLIGRYVNAIDFYRKLLSEVNAD